MIPYFSYFHFILFLFLLIIHILIISEADSHYWINRLDNIMNFLLGLSLGNFFWLIFISMILMIDSNLEKRDPSEYSVFSIFYLIILLFPINIFIGLRMIKNIRLRIKKIFFTSEKTINSFELSIFLSYITVPIFFIFIIENLIAFSVAFLFIGWIISTIAGLTIEIFRISIKKLLVFDKLY